MRTLLIDGDILVYRVAHQCQEIIHWDSDTWTYWGDVPKARRSITTWVKRLQDRLAADESVVFISDSRLNWRHSVYPQYKGNRAAWGEAQRDRDPLELPKPGPQRPILHKALRDILREEFGASEAASLEADDLLGIRSTTPTGGDRIIVSADKDLRTVPGRLFNPDRPVDGIMTYSRAEADRFHLTQTLTGDPTDHYLGCKGVGPVKAEKLLPQAAQWDGQAAWAAVVGAYEKAGLSEDDAVTQARIARVLRHGDYDFNTGEVRLWTPEEL